MATDPTRLAYSSQDYLLRCELYAARQFSLADVDSSGADEGAAPADTGDVVPFNAAFDGISSLGTISGSIASGGFSCDLTIPQTLADFADFYGIVLKISTWYGGIPGVVGAAGTADEADIFRGWMRAASVKRVFQGTTATFTMRSGSAFLAAMAFSRGIDYGAGLDHGGPTTSNAIIAHLIEYHTNWSSRHPDPPGYGIYLPDHALDAFSLSEGSVMDMIRGLANNFALDADVYCRRGDDLVIGAHPNLGGYNPDPIIELTDDLMLEIDAEETPAIECTQCTIAAQHSDQTEYIASYYGGSGVGSRPKYQIRTDDDSQADYLAAAMFAHLNRRFRNVRVKLPLNVSIDLGDTITITTDLPQRGIHWASKKFQVRELSYSPDLSRRTFVSDLVCDEVIV